MTTADRYGIVQHARSGEIYVAEFETNPDNQGVYHIMRAAGPFPREEVINEDRQAIWGDTQIEQALANNPDADEDGKWLDGQPGDVW